MYFNLEYGLYVFAQSRYSAVSTGDGNCLFNSVSIALIGE